MSSSTIGSRSLTYSATQIFSEPLPNPVGIMGYLAHEGGHGLGMHHARSLRVPGTALPRIFFWGTEDEYGDVFDTMGNSPPHLHHNVIFKLALGWLDEADVPEVSKSGVYQISALSVAGGIKGLRIRRDPNETRSQNLVWLEYRQPIGYDTYLPPAGSVGPIAHLDPLLRAPSSGTYLVDFTPQTSGAGTLDFRDAALAVGQTWLDTDSPLAISVLNTTPTAVTIAIFYR